MRTPRARLLAFTLTTLALAGCVRSIHPIGARESGVFDPKLVGFWGSDDSTELYEVTADGEGGYRMVSTDEECNQGFFGMYLTELNGHRFLNVYPEEPEAYANELYASLLVRAFAIVRIELAESSVTTWLMDPDWLEKRLAEDPEGLSLANLDEALLTGPTEEVKALYLDYFKSPAVLKEPGQLIRLTAQKAAELRSRCTAEDPSPPATTDPGGV